MSSREVSINEQIHETQDDDTILSFYPADIDGEDIDDLNISEENIIKYENTYRMDSKKPFDERLAKVVLTTEIKNHFNDETKYDQNEAIQTCIDISLIVRNRIREMDFDRYKIVCIVGIMEKKSQGVLSEVKFLRDINRDKYVKTKFENNNLVATIVVGAFYHE
ncbi:PREDICTED: tctex1 domain-containing protein 1-like [Diuraphis noxia]|uniref:tctex1 domain-containing protein 1-like n=1 Tax=Diuraphis noxia TaxID=143948 RepID=UPI0007636973|nr:PREDICTED: tctex1 domain-containing protein 1-like [Diuraphis noxia]